MSGGSVKDESLVDGGMNFRVATCNARLTTA